MAGKFICTNNLLEHHGRPIFCLKFNGCDPAYKGLLATVGKNRASVYQCHPGGRVEVVQIYTDADPDEDFFVCEWSARPGGGGPLLLVAGQKAALHVLDCTTQSLVMSLKGHGRDIHDIGVHPSRPQLVLTASKDESVRLWSLAGRCCVAVFKGEGAHAHEVLSLDWHPWNPQLFASAGMDSAVKVWSLAGIWPKVEQSDAWADGGGSKGLAFKAALGEQPIFSSQRLHGNYVDCVRWLGDLLLTKSVDGCILLTRPGQPEDPAHQTSSTFTKLRSFDLPKADMWWVRFSVSLAGDLLACGNGAGSLFLWDPSASAGGPAQAVLQHKSCTRVVRQTSISADGDMVAAGCDDGSVWLWERAPAGAPGPAADGAKPARGRGRAAGSGGRGGGGGGEGGATSAGGSRGKSGGRQGASEGQQQTAPGQGAGTSGGERAQRSGSDGDGEQEGTSPDPARRRRRGDPAAAAAGGAGEVGSPETGGGGQGGGGTPGGAAEARAGTTRAQQAGAGEGGGVGGAGGSKRQRHGAQPLEAARQQRGRGGGGGRGRGQGRTAGRRGESSGDGVIVID